MSEVKYGIQYENYCNTLASGFSMLMTKQNLVDTTLMCNTHTLRVHKVVLAASCIYFQEVLKSHPGDLLIILKMEFVVLKALVEYIYSGKTIILESNIDDLISAAKFLKIKGLSELKNDCENLPEFAPPVIFNHPYASTTENFPGSERENSLQENDNPSAISYFKNPNNVVVRIPIEINSHNINSVEPPKGRNKYKQHCYDRYNENFPKNRSSRRKSHFTKQEHKSSILGTKLLHRATKKVLRKEEKSSMQIIQEIKSLHGQQNEDTSTQLDLSKAVESILNPKPDCEEFIINNHDEQTAENIEISEQNFSNDHMWPMDNSSNIENSDINSTLTEYVDVLKSTGLPTDVPIFFELEDGSYVNISGEVLLNMVQSNSVQYEVVERTQDTEQLLQSGVAKSIDQISEEISATADLSLEQTSLMDCLDGAEHMDMNKIDDAINDFLETMHKHKK